MVRRQARSRHRRVSDGEFGKSISWSQYALSGCPASSAGRSRSDTANPFKRGADRTRFAEFYAELDAHEASPPRPKRSAPGRSHYTGQAELDRDIDNFKAALEEHEDRRGLPAGRGAGERHPRPQERILQERRGAAGRRSREPMRTEYKMIIDAGFLVQLDDARNAVTYDRMVPPASFADYRRWLAQQVEIINHAIEGPAAGSHPLSRLLGLMAGPACQRRAAQGHRRPDPAR